MKGLVVLVAIFLTLSTIQADICKSRAKWGNTCKSCSERVYCMENAGEWQEIPLETCAPGYICEDSAGDCVKSNATCYSPALQKEFDCKVAGIFPDPLNCKHFYVCFSTITASDPRISFLRKSRLISSSDSEYLQAIRLECPRGKLYSARTQSCSVSEEKGTCTKPICKRPGQQAAWPDDEEIFYICTTVGGEEKRELYPLMLRCSAGERFNGARCVRAFQPSISTTSSEVIVTTRDADIPQPAPIPIGTSTTRTPITTAAPPITTAAPVVSKCSSKGLSPHPSDCTKYYFCDANLSAKIYNCPANQKYSAEFKSCIRGQC